MVDTSAASRIDEPGEREMTIRGPALRRALAILAVPGAVFSTAAFASDTLNSASAHAVSPRNPRVASGLVTVKAANPEPKTESIQNAAAIVEDDEVLKALDTWVRAWNSKDVRGYFAAYAKNFQPSDGESRAAWERMRQTRIEDKEYIYVRIESPVVSVKQNQATVRFLQVYISDRLREEGKKTLLFAKTDGKWQIVLERKQ
jgi:hypothetical protein